MEILNRVNVGLLVELASEVEVEEGGSILRCILLLENRGEKWIQ